MTRAVRVRAVIQEVDPIKDKPKNNRGWRKGVSKYNWALKFKQGYFELKRGTDYHVQTVGMVTTIRQMAAKHNKGVTIKILEGENGTTLKVTVHRRAIRQGKVNTTTPKENNFRIRTRT